MKFNKILITGCLFFTSLVFGAPVTPPNGGQGISNCPSCTTTVTTAMNFPLDINLQNAYDQSVTKQIVFPLGQGIVFKNSALANQFLISDSVIAGYNNFVISKDGLSGVSIYGTEDPVSTIFQVKSVSFGSNPFPYMTSAQENAIDLTDAKPGWGVFDTDKETFTIYDGQDIQHLLTDEHVLAGANTSVVNNANGTITISSSGGGTAPAPAYAAYSVSGNFAARPGNVGTFVAVPVSSGFNDDQDACFTSSIVSIGGINTPISVYTCAQTQFFEVDQSVSMQGINATYRQYIYAIAVKRAGGSIVTTNFRLPATQNSDPANDHPTSMHGIVQLAQGDGVFTQVYGSSSDQTAPTTYINSKVSSMAGSIPNTDGLPQGANNLYLSQNGGTTFQNMSGSGIINNLPKFNSVGGQLIDSGIAAANVIQSSGSYANPAWITSLASSKITGFSAFSLVGTDASSNLTNNVQNIRPNLGGVNIVNNFSPLVGAQTAVEFSSSLSYGNYLSFGGFGPYMGVDSATNGLFIAGNAYYDVISSGFFRFNTGSSGAIRVNASGVQIQHMVTGPGFTAASLITDLSDDGVGNINLPNLTVSQVLATDASKNIVSTGFAPSSVILSSGSYADPIWITSLSGSKLTATSVDLTTKVTGILPGANGGTGVNNSSTITVGGNLNTASSFTTSGANSLTLTTTATTNATLPSGTTTLVPTTGTGATGTWGISISGNSATVTTNANLTGDVTSIGNATAIANNAVTYAKLQQIAPSSLIGNSVGGPFSTAHAITLGSTLGFSGTAVQTIGMSGDVISSANSFSTTIANLAVTNAKIANSTIDLTTKVTGTLPFTNGGFGFATATLGDLFYASATNTPGKLTDVATGQVLTSGGVGAAPAYSASLSSTILSNIPKMTTTIITSGSGNYTPPANCTRIVVTAWGGGGGAGAVEGITSSAGGAGGGGSGGTSVLFISAPFSAPYAYSVGAGGSGGLSNFDNGVAGSATTFGPMTASGGGFGTGANASLSAAVVQNGAGGAASGGNINMTGNAGGVGMTLSATVAIGGFGAGAPLGSGNVGATLAGNGINGSAPGGGGSAGTSNVITDRTSGNGATGRIVIKEYYNG